MPVIDIYTHGDPNAKSDQIRKSFVADRYAQVVIRGAKPDYHGDDDQIAQAVIAWLKQQE